jgi:hypothetical protein
MILAHCALAKLPGNIRPFQRKFKDNTVGNARTNVIGSRILFVIASVIFNIKLNISS